LQHRLGQRQHARLTILKTAMPGVAGVPPVPRAAAQSRRAAEIRKPAAFTLSGGTLEVWAVTDYPAPAACPGCGTISGRVHETVLTRPRR